MSHCEIVYYSTPNRLPTPREIAHAKTAGANIEGIQRQAPFRTHAGTGIRMYNDADKPIGELCVVSWLFNGCSAAGLDGLTRVYLGGVYSDAIKDKDKFIDEVYGAVLRVLDDGRKSSGYNPHRVFCNLPGTRAITPSENLAYHFMSRAYAGVPPVYSFMNRAHGDNVNHLYDLDTDLMLKWQEDYHAKKRNVVANSVQPAATDDWFDEFVGFQAGKAPSTV